MADLKTVVMIGEDYIVGTVAKAFLDDDEAGGSNGDSYFAAANTAIQVWDWPGSQWSNYTPNVNSNIGVDTTKLASPANFFGPDVQLLRRLEALWGETFYFFKYADDVKLNDGGAWKKSPSSGTAVYADMLTEWTSAKAHADVSADNLIVQCIFIYHGKSDVAADADTNAYEENLEKFIKDLRYDFLVDGSTDPIPIVLCRIGGSGGNTDVVRKAQEDVVARFPKVELLDTDDIHAADANLIPSGFGMFQLGELMYDKYLVASANAGSSTLEDYTLATLRSDIRTEFGLNSTDTTMNDIIDRKINDAIQWIAKQRVDWNWLKKGFSIDVPAEVTDSSVSITQGERVVTNLVNTTKLRDIFVGGDTNDIALDGYLIESGDSTNGFKIQSQYLGETISAGEATIVQGYFELPADFARMQNLELIGSQTFEQLVFRNTLEFEKIKRQAQLQQGLSTNIKSVYTVIPDPIGKLDRLFVAVYPYITDLRVLQGFYWKVPTKLVLDTDVPDLPKSDRVALLHGAYWFMSGHLKNSEDRITFYRVQALESLKALLKNYQFSEEPDVDPVIERTGFITMPSGYPSARNLHA